MFHDCRFAVTVSYYGISFNLVDLSGNKYSNFILGGFIELLAYILTLVVLRHVGRRLALCLYMLLGGLVCVLTVIIKELKLDSKYQRSTLV